MDYKTMAEIVKSRGDLILEKKRTRRIRLIRITSGVTALCAAAIIGFGIWHNNTAKDPSSLNFNKETTAATTDNVSDVTTVTATNNTSDVTTVTETNKTTDAATVTAADNASAGTTAALDNKHTVTTKVLSTAAAKKTQTTATAATRVTSSQQPAAQTTTVSSSAVTVTTTTESITFINHRRVYYMNKLSAGFAAMLVASSAVPKPVDAVNDIGMRRVPFEVISTKYDINNFSFSEWHNDESLIDIDKNGKFDINDVYRLHCMAKEAEDTGCEELTYDLNNDGLFDSGDVSELIVYYTCFNKIDRSIFESGLYSEDFLKYFAETSEMVHGMYDIFTEALETKKPDLDVDGSGKIDIADVMDIYCFKNIFDSPCVTYDYMDYDNLSFEDKLKVYNELTKNKFPSESETKCIEVLRTIADDELVYPVFSDYLIRYYFENVPFQPEYSDYHYYEILWETRYDERRLYAPEHKDALRDFQYAVEDTEWEMGLPRTDVRADVDLNNIEADYEVYKQKVAEGLLPEPDMNFDGRITFVDHFMIDDIFNNYRYRKSDIYTDDIIDNFLYHFDVNGNGISGDAADCSIAQVYICEKLGIKTQKEKEYEDFRDAWIKGEVTNYSGTNCLEGSRYGLTDPDDLFSLCYNYVYAFTYPKSETRELKYLQYYTDVKAGLAPEPDVDMNGVIDENDYIYAENTLYSQTHTSQNINIVPENVMDNYIRNFDLDGSGVSGDAMDTLIILNYISRECGIDTSDLDIMAEKARGHYTEIPQNETVVTMPIITTTGTTTAVGNDTGLNGDANCDTDIDLSDAILVMQALANPDKYEVGGTSKNHITVQGKKNADVDRSTKGLTANDALCIQQYLIGSRESL